MHFCPLLIFFQNKLFFKNLSRIPPECQIVWTLIRPKLFAKLSADGTGRQTVKAYVNYMYKGVDQLAHPGSIISALVVYF